MRVPADREAMPICMTDDDARPSGSATTPTVLRAEPLFLRRASAHAWRQTRIMCLPEGNR